MPDDHDDDVSLLAGMQQVVATCTAAPDPNACKIASRRLTRLQRSLFPVRKVIIASLDGSDDVCQLHYDKEQLFDIKKELCDTRNSLLTLDLKEGDELKLP